MKKDETKVKPKPKRVKKVVDPIEKFKKEKKNFIGKISKEIKGYDKFREKLDGIIEAMDDHITTIEELLKEEEFIDEGYEYE